MPWLNVEAQAYTEVEPVKTPEAPRENLAVRFLRGTNDDADRNTVLCACHIRNSSEDR